MRFARWGARGMGIGASAIALPLMLAPPALAVGPGTQPSSAPTISLNTTYYGDDTNCDSGDGCFNFWQLPAILAQDEVTVEWKATSEDHATDLCLTGSVDDYSWDQNRCNLDTDTSYASSSAAGRQDTFVATRNATDAYLEFGNEGFEYGVPYQFVVTAVRHEVGLNVRTPAHVHRGSKLHGSATTTNGQAVRDGMVASLIVRWHGGKQTETATTSGGALTWALHLPRSASGKRLVIHAVHAASATYRAAASVTTHTRVA